MTQVTSAGKCLNYLLFLPQAVLEVQMSLRSHHRSSEHSLVVENQGQPRDDEDFGTGQLKWQRLKVRGQPVPSSALLLQA